MHKHVFISYARSDGAEMAERLFRDLINKSINVWYDQYSIAPGEDWDREIDKGLNEALAVLVLLTPGSVLSVQVKCEWNYAINKLIPIIPILVISCDAPRTLSVFNWLDFQQNYDKNFSILLKRLLNITNTYQQNLRETLQAYKVAQAEAENPERFEARIKLLEQTIEGWKESQVHQDVRIESELQKEKAKSYKGKGFSAVVKTVGRKPYDVFTLFKNRVLIRQELQELLLDSNTRMISVIGRGGIGKTATVSKVLFDIEKGSERLIQDHSLNGIIYVGARTEGITLEKIFMSMVKLLDEFTEASLLEIILDAELPNTKKLTQLIANLEGTKSIIFLDNFEDYLDQEGRIVDEQLEFYITELLRSNVDIKLLITSRIPLKFDGTLMKYDHRVPLVEGIPDEEAIELLRELDTHGYFGLRDAPSHQLEHIIKLSHGVPRSLEVIASIFANDPFLSIDELTSSVFNQDSNTQSLVQEMYKKLDRESLTIIEVLAVFEKPVASLGLEYVLNETAPHIDVRSKLMFLTQTHTVKINRTDKTVSLHPIDRDYIYGNLQETDSEKLKGLEILAADYYAEIAISRETWKTIDDLQNTLREFSHRIRAGQFNMALQLLIKLDEEFLYRWGYYKRLLEMYFQVKDQLTLADETSYFFSRIAQIYFRLGYSEETVNYAQKALAVTPEGIRRNQVLITLGDAYNFLGKYLEALDCFEQGLSNAKRYSNRGQEAYFMTRIGYAHYSLGNNQKMLSAYTDAMAIAKDIDDINLEMTILGYLSKGYSQMGQYEKTLEYAQRALPITRILGDRYEECMRLSDLGDGSLRLGRYVDAIGYLETALEIAEELEATSAIGYRAWLLGWSYLGIKEFAKASRYLERALEIGRELQNPHLVQRSAYRLILAHLLGNDLNAAKSVMQTIPVHGGVLRLKHHITLLKAIIAMYDAKPEEAFEEFQNTVNHANEIINESPDFFEAWYGLLLGQAGLSLLDEDGAEAHKIKAMDALERSIKLSSAQGMFLDVHFILQQMSQFDKKGQLNELHGYLSQIISL
jgi:tetratricopeptide (TPR) repeat protein